jgi:hypothetical protein
MKKHMRKALSFVLVLGLLFSAMAVSALTVPSMIAPVLAETQSTRSLLPADYDKTIIRKQFREAKAAELSELLNKLANTDYMRESVRVMVELKAPAASESGKSESSVIASQKSVRDAVRKITGSKVINGYGYLANGFSCMAKRSDFQKIRDLPGVMNVVEVPVYKLTMFNAPDMTGVSAVWNHGLGFKEGFKGEGMLISIIDSGIDDSHKDMRISDGVDVKLEQGDVAELISEHGLPGKYFSPKIPYGYNYADKSQEIVEKHLSGRPEDEEKVSMHGMHVAGIAAANATDDDLAAFKGIRGIAPEAQLLAMKVFSNNHVEGAYLDDILMAIEDSVKLGADVINMSIAKHCGFSDVDDAVARAIQAASEAGTLVVIGAANAGLAYDSHGGTSNDLGQYINAVDSGSVGSDSTVEAALSVASIDNTKIFVDAMSYTVKGGDAITFPVAEQQEPAGGRTFKDDEWIELVDCGLGSEADVADKVLEGKYALVQGGGDLTFKEKAINVQAKRAIGIIVYNHQPQSGPPTSQMEGVEESGISSVFTTLDAGDAMRAAMDGGNISVKVKTKIESTFLAAASETAEPSSFTSWGPTPELNFKPEVAGIGGNVYSTLNNDEYGTMWGTSLATPHVSGASALIMQAMKDSSALSGLKGLERTKYLKTILSNTATVLMDGDVIHSPRQVGAGLINVKDAIDSRVTVTHHGSGNIELLDFTGSKTFTLDFKNYGASAVTFTLKPPVVYTGVHDGDVYDIVAPGASVTTASTSITVPANGTVSADFTINAGTVNKNYVEGYLEFEAAGVPDLSIPFLGYVGHWGNDLPIFDYVEGLGPNGDGIFDLFMEEYEDFPKIDRILSATQLYMYSNPYIRPDCDPTPAGNWSEWIYGKVFDPMAVGFNTNPDDKEEDGYIKALAPRVGAFRGVQNAECFITDEDGNVLRQVGRVDFIEKTSMFFLVEIGQPIPLLYNTHWDGKLYDKSNGEFIDAEEGQYYYNVRARMNENSEWQSISIPVKIDNTAPTGLTIQQNVPYEHGATSVTINCGQVTDGDGTGIDKTFSGLTIFKDGKWRRPDQKISVDDHGNLFVTIKENPTLFAQAAKMHAHVVMADYVGNTTLSDDFVLYEDRDFIEPAKLIRDELGGNDSWIPAADGFVTYNKKESQVLQGLEIPEEVGYVFALTSNGVVRSTVNGNGAVADKPYLHKVAATDGVPVVLELKGYDASDAEIASAEGKLLVDLTAPTLALTETAIETNTGGLPYIANTETVKVMVTDNFADGQNQVIGFDGEDQFALDVGEDGTVTIPVAANGNLVVLKPVDFAGNFGDSVQFYVLPEGVEPDNILDYKPVPGDFWVSNPSDLSGIFNSVFTFLYMDEEADEHTVTLEGGSEGLNSLTFDGDEVLGDGGSWTKTLTLKEGLTYIRVKAVNTENLVIYDMKLRLICDSHVPNLVFETDPRSIEGTFVFSEGNDPDEISGNRPPLVIWMNKEKVDVNISGTASDNTFGYKLAINGDIVLDYLDLDHLGPEANERPFEYRLKDAVDKDFIRIEIEDVVHFYAPTSLLQKIQVRGDMIAPTLIPFCDKTADADPKEELTDDLVFNVEDLIVLSAAAKDEDGGSGLDGDVEIRVNGELYDGQPLAAGVYGVVFRVKDHAGNETIVIRNFTITGQTVINTGGDLALYPEQVKDFDPMKGVTATDAIDKDITDKVTVRCDLPESFEAGIPGTYVFSYRVTNSTGKTTVASRKVKILGRPQIFGAIDTTITEGGEFDPMKGISAYDNDDGDLTEAIKVDGSVDVANLGVYTLTYSVKDSHGNLAVAVRKVTVEKKPAPADPITPGSMSVEIPSGSTEEYGVGLTADGNVVYEKGKSTGMALKMNGVELGDFLYVSVDGKKTAPGNYTVAAGSIIVKLKKDFLDMLSVGKHVIGIHTTKGVGTKTIEIKAASEPMKPVVPATGESQGWLLYVGGLFIVASAIFVIVPIIMRRRRDGHNER